MDNHTYILILLAQPSLSETEQQFLLDHEAELRQLLQEQFIMQKDNNEPSAHAMAMLQQWHAKTQATTEAIPEHSVKRMPWLRYVVAAILILAIGSGVYFFNTQSYKSKKSSQITVQTKAAAQSIPPGTDKAIWTLSSGKQIELDSTVLDMTANNIASNNIGYNELRTPRGGQYQLILPDGSKVWLNAASSIKYPVVFNGNERRVDITGEAYFEIAKDATKPFKVYSGSQQIEVLGTSFNVNTYDDEPIKKTTLITGSIKIINNNQTAILQPGQQANIPILSILPIRLILVQTEESIAWKNNIFSFNNLSIEEVARQLSRWYNIDISFPEGIPNKTIKGKMGRDLNLSEAIEVLKDLGITTSSKDKQLIITNSK